MPFLIPILGVATSFFSGAYIGTVINNASEEPDVVIKTDSAGIQEIKKLTTSDFLMAGVLGVTGYYIYKKLLK